MEDSLIDNESTRTQVQHDLTEAQALDGLMGALKVLKIILILFQTVITSMRNHLRNKHMMQLYKMLKI